MDPTCTFLIGMVIGHVLYYVIREWWERRQERKVFQPFMGFPPKIRK